MALTQEQQKALAKSKPDLIAHLEVKISNVETMEDVFQQQEKGEIISKTVYSKIIAPTKEYMDLAIKNYATNYGALSVKTITYDEYKDATNT